MKHKFLKFLDKPTSFIWVMIAMQVVALADRNYGYFLALGVVLFLYKMKGNDWTQFGWTKPLNYRTVLFAILISLIVHFGFIPIEELIQDRFGETDISSISDIEGNTISFLIILFVSWTFAAIGEELIFRGYFMRQLARLLGDRDGHWIIAGVITSFYFGVSHFYQGLSGILSVSLFSLFYAGAYYFKRDNLWYPILLHGFTNMISLTMLYLGMEI